MAAGVPLLCHVRTQIYVYNVTRQIPNNKYTVEATNSVIFIKASNFT